MVSVCLPSDAVSQRLLSYLGFSYLGRGISLHGYSSKVQPSLLTLDVGSLLLAATPVLGPGVAPLSCARAPWFCLTLLINLGNSHTVLWLGLCDFIAKFNLWSGTKILKVTQHILNLPSSLVRNLTFLFLNSLRVVLPKLHRIMKW